MFLSSARASSPIRCLGLLLTCVCLPPALTAQTIYANNVSSTWGSTGQWLGGVVPDSGSSVVIENVLPYTIIVDANAVYNSLSHVTTGTLQVNSGATLSGQATSLQRSLLHVSGNANFGPLTMDLSSTLMVHSGGSFSSGFTQLARGQINLEAGATGTTGNLNLGITNNFTLTAEGTLTSTGVINIGHAPAGNFDIRLSGTWNANATGALHLGASNGGTLRIYNGGTLNVNNGSGAIALGEDFDGGTTRDTVLRIGFISTAAPGTINAASITGYSNRGVLELSHNASAYEFATLLQGNLRVSQLAGTTTLTGAHTYSGGTTVTGGTLRVNGSATNSLFSVSGGTLGGSGAVGDTILHTGSLAPGNSAGTLTLDSLTWNGGTLAFELGANQAGSDQLAVSGAFTKGTGPTFYFNFTDAATAPIAGATYTLLTFGSQAGFTTGDFSYSYTGALSGFSGAFDLQAGRLNFTVAAIPEPATWSCLFGLAVLGVAIWRRSREKAGRTA